MVATPLVQKIQIRKASRKDLPALEWGGEFAHFRHIFAEAYRLMEKGTAVMWIADLMDEGLIGQLFVQLYNQNHSDVLPSNHAYIYGFRVRPEFRGLGIGSRLLQTAENDLLYNGFLRIALNVARNNEAAKRLYERFGYQVVGPEPGIWSYLDDKGKRCFVNEPAWRMEKNF